MRSLVLWHVAIAWSKWILLLNLLLGWPLHRAAVNAWIPFADHSSMLNANGGGGHSLSAIASGLNGMGAFGETPGSLAGMDFASGGGAGMSGGMSGSYGSSAASNYVPATAFNPMNAYRSSSGSIGSM